MQPPVSHVWTRAAQVHRRHGSGACSPCLLAERALRSGGHTPCVSCQSSILSFRPEFSCLILAFKGVLHPESKSQIPNLNSLHDITAVSHTTNQETIPTSRHPPRSPCLSARSASLTPIATEGRLTLSRNRDPRSQQLRRRCPNQQTLRGTRTGMFVAPPALPLARAQCVSKTNIFLTVPQDRQESPRQPFRLQGAWPC